MMINEKLLERIDRQDLIKVTELMILSLNIKGSDVKETEGRLKVFFETYCKNIKKAELYFMFAEFCKNYEFKNWNFANIWKYYQPLKIIEEKEFKRRVEMGNIDKVHILTNKGYVPQVYKKIICV